MSKSLYLDRHRARGLNGFFKSEKKASNCKRQSAWADTKECASHTARRTWGTHPLGIELRHRAEKRCEHSEPAQNNVKIMMSRLTNTAGDVERPLLRSSVDGATGVDRSLWW